MQRLLGTWKLISATSADLATGAARDLYGADPQGFITYGPDGRMMVLVTFGARPKPAAAVASSAEAEALYRSMMGYAGRYAIDGDTVTHTIDVAWNEAWAGTRQTRHFRFEGERIILATEPTPDPFTGTPSVRTIVWERTA